VNCCVGLGTPQFHAILLGMLEREREHRGEGRSGFAFVPMSRLDREGGRIGSIRKETTGTRLAIHSRFHGRILVRQMPNFSLIKETCNIIYAKPRNVDCEIPDTLVYTLALIATIV